MENNKRLYTTVMLKPASGLCNMACKYCFYKDETANREIANYGMMAIETVEKVLEKVLAVTTRQCTIAFQGGEPTLRGLDFFKQIGATVEKYNVNHCQIDYALQTNGLLIDENWCQFFKDNKYLVGVSLDGNKEIHDLNRVDQNGNGTFNRVMKSIELMKKYNVDFNILTVLTSASSRSYRKIYNFYDKNNFRYQQYIPCLDPLDQPRGTFKYSLRPQNYQEYLKTAFDCWYDDFMSGKKKYHRYFDNLLAMVNGQFPESCGMLGICSNEYVVEADGSVFPCDFYMLDQYCIGNFNTDSIDEIEAKRKEIRFIEDSRKVEDKCKNCQWYMLCRTGCRRDRDYYSEGLKLNYYCQAYQNFFEYAVPRLIQLRNIINIR